MNTKLISILICLLFVCCVPASAQKLHRYYLHHKYSDVLRIIEKSGVAGISDAIDLRDCGTVTLNFRRYDLSSKFYEEAWAKNQSVFGPEDLLNYAFALIMSGNEKQLLEGNAFKIPMGNAYWLDHIKRIAQYRINHSAGNTSSVEIMPLNLPDILNQYGISYGAGKIYYSAPTHTYKKDGVLYENRILIERKKDFTGIVSASLNEKGKIATPIFTSQKVASDFRIATLNISESEKVKFLTLVPLKGGPEQIKPDGMIHRFPFNSKRYSCAMPFFDENKARLYFCSDMPGGFGGWDIYFTNWQDGKWSSAVNMGPQVNTPFDDIFPSVFNDVLVFASNAREGLGGFDNYAYIEQDNQTVNLLPFNTKGDDYSLNFIRNDSVQAVGIRDSLSTYYSSGLHFDDLLNSASSKNNDVLIENTNNETDKKNAANYSVDKIADKTPISKAKTTPIFNRFNAQVKTAVHFDINSSLIEPKYQYKLDSLADLISTSNLTTVFVRGYADVTGDNKYNDYISYQRAQNVLVYLKSKLKTIDHKQFCIVVTGKSYASGNTSLSKFEDRKAEVFTSNDQLFYDMLYVYRSESKQTVDDIANLFNNNPVQLREINKMGQTELPDGGILLVGIQGIHQVKSGENVFRLGLNYGCEKEKIQLVNKKSDTSILTDELLIIPLKKNN